MKKKKVTPGSILSLFNIIPYEDEISNLLVILIVITTLLLMIGFIVAVIIKVTS